MLPLPIPEQLINHAGERMDFAFHQGAPNRSEVIVLGHGVTGHKDRPFLVEIAEGIAARGFNVLRHSWSGNGDSEGAFAESNITKEVADLDAILGTLSGLGYTIAYAGHSMGGAVGVRRAARDPRIRWLISLAGIVHARDFAESIFGHLTPGEGLMLGKPGKILPQAYMDDLRGIDTVIDDAAKIAVPWLLVHGTADELVPIRHSEDAFALPSGDKQFVRLEGADHLFARDAIPALVDSVANWCDAQFAGGRDLV